MKFGAPRLSEDVHMTKTTKINIDLIGLAVVYTLADRMAIRQAQVNESPHSTQDLHFHGSDSDTSE